MARKYKRGSGARFTMIDHWLSNSTAWKAMKPGPRQLYFELKKRFNGRNNGQIFLSHRDASRELNVDRSTVAKYFRVLVEQGFIVATEAHSLGVDGCGKATKWRLTEERSDGFEATKDFMKISKNKNPR